MIAIRKLRANRSHLAVQRDRVAKVSLSVLISSREQRFASAAAAASD